MIKKNAWIIMRFLLYFCMNAFVISCSFFLFLHNMEFTEEQIQMNAKLTFGNIILLSILFLIIDMIRTKWMIERPVNRINDGLSQIRQGNLDIQIEELSSFENAVEFNGIIQHINEMCHELASVETLRNDFISNVSHELKTPLAVIQNYGKLLQDKNLSDEKRMEYAKAITKTSHRLADLITNILKLNKLENQQIYPESKKYNLSEQLCECLLQFESIWEEKEIEIDVDIQEDVYVNADSELLSLVWNNLMSNALKFTDKNGKVFVGLKTEEKHVIVTVMDNGCGMDKESGKRIFDKFYQADASRATRGNGLGLALVKKVIDILNGEILVQSELGKGSIFEVKLEILNEEVK